MLRGGKSLTTNVGLAFTGSIGKIAGSMAKGVAELTLDDEYLARRAGKVAPRTLEQGVNDGMEGVRKAFSSGFSGFINKPMAGARKNGFEGLMSGLGQGTVGLFVKPMVGLADAVSAASEGLHTDMDANKQARQRLPRALGPAGELVPYSEPKAKAQQLLTDLTLGSNSRVRALSEGRFCGQGLCGGPNDFGSKCIITTTVHVVAIILSGGGSSSGSSGSGASVEWLERTTSVAAVETTGNGLVLHLRDGGMRFVPCAHSSGARQELFRVVNSAVTGSV